MWITALQLPKLAKKEGQKVLKALEQIFPCGLWWRLWWDMLSSCSPWTQMTKQVLQVHAACGGLHIGAGACPRKAVTLWESMLEQAPGRPVDPWRDPTLEQVYWQDLWPCRGPTLGQPVPEGLHPMEGTRFGVLCEELQTMWRRMWTSNYRNSWRTDSCERNLLEHGLRVRSPPSEDEEETICDELTSSHSPYPWASGREEAKNIGLKFNQEEGRNGKKVFSRFGFSSHPSILFWLAINQTDFPAFCPWQQQMRDLSLSLSKPTSL